MSQAIKPVDGAQSDLPLPTNKAAVPLDQVSSMGDDEVLELTRKIRVRHITSVLEQNNGQFPSDLDEQKVLLTALKDLDSQAGRNKQTESKEKMSAVDREVTLAVMRLMNVVGDQPLKREPIAGQERPIPSVSDAKNLDPLKVVPDETSVGVDHRSFDEFNRD